MLLVTHDPVDLVPLAAGNAPAPLPSTRDLDGFPIVVGDRVYAVGRYVFRLNDVWLTAVERRTRIALWTRRFERHLCFLREEGGTALLLALRDGELRLLELDVASGSHREVARLGFGAFDLGDRVSIRENMAYVPGPSRLVAIDLDQRKVAWEARLRADHILPAVTASGDVFVAWSCEGRGGMETTLGKVNPSSGAVEERARMAARCHGLIGNDVAVFARIEAANGVIPFGRKAVAAFTADGVGEPLLLSGAGPWAASGRHFFMVNGDRADLVSHDGRALTWSQGRLPSLSSGSPSIVGDRACLYPSGAVVDLRAFARMRSLPRERVRGLLDAVPRPASDPPPSRSMAVAAPPAAWLPTPASKQDDDPRRIPPGLLRVLARGDSGQGRWQLSAVGLRMVDPRGVWSARAGRDPSLVDFAQRSDGSFLCVYDYPPHRGELPVVEFSPVTGRVTYVASDFESFLADHLHAEAEVKPGAVEIASDVLGVVPEPLGEVVVPPWFQAAHGATASWDLVATAHQRSDELGRERLLVALARDARGAELDRIREELRAIYRGLGWSAHQEALFRWNEATMSTH